MNVGLRYSLEMELGRARSEVRKFLGEVESGLDKSFRKRRGGGQGGFNPVSDYVNVEAVQASARKVRAVLDREANATARQVERGVREYISAERQKAQATIAAIRQQNAVRIEAMKQADAAWKEHDKIEKAKTKTAEAEAAKRAAAEKKEYEAALKAADRTRKILSTIRGQNEARKAREANVEPFGPHPLTAAQKYENWVQKARDKVGEQNRVTAARQAAYQKHLQLEEKFAAARHRIEIEGAFLTGKLYAEQVKARDRTLTAILALERRAGTLSSQQLNNEINNQLRAYQRQTAALTRQQAISGGGGRFGQIGFGLFQAQQAVEDFAIGYSVNGLSGGLRGAINNVSALGAIIGGPLGITALVVAMGAAVGTATNWFGLFGSEVKRTADDLEAFLSLRDDLVGMTVEFSKLSTMEAVGKAKEDDPRLRIEALVEERKELTRQINLRQQFNRVLAGPTLESGTGKTLNFLIRWGGLGRLIPGLNTKGYAEKQEANQRELERMREELRGMGIDPDNKEELEELRKKNDEYLRQLDKLQQEQDLFNNILMHTGNVAEATAKRIETARSRLKSVSGGNSTTGSLITDGESEISRLEEARDKAAAPLNEEFQRVSRGRQSEVEKQRELARLGEQINRIMEEYAAKIEAAAEAAVILAKQHVDLVNLADEAAKQAQKAYDIAMDQARAAKELVKTEEDRLKVIQEQRRLQQESFEQARFESTIRVRGLQASEELDALSKRADSLRNQVRRRQEFLNESLRGRGNEGARRMVNAEAQRYLRFIDEEEERRSGTIEARRARDVEQLQSDRENLLRGRASGLSNLARQASDVGDFEQARKLNEQARSTLEQLQALQMSQVGQGTAAQAQAAIARAQQTQQQLQATFGAEAEFTRASRDRAIANYQQILSLAEAIEEEMETIKAIQDHLDSAEWVKQLDVDRAAALRGEFERIQAIYDQVNAGKVAAESAGEAGQFPAVAGDILSKAPVPLGPPTPAHGSAAPGGSTLNIGGLNIYNSPNTASLMAELKAREANLSIRSGR